MTDIINSSGLIGYNGEWIECKDGLHTFMMAQHLHLAPFVVIHYGKAEFESKFLCRPGFSASQKQIEVVFDWCIANKLDFESVFFDAE